MASGIGKSEDEIFLKMVDEAAASIEVCAECGRHLPFNPHGFLKPWHCGQSCYNKWYRKFIKKNKHLLK